MRSKAEIKQIAMRNAIRIWECQNIDQLDPIIKLFIEVFSTLIYENENSIENIKESLLEQISHSLTPDTLISAKPAHAVMTAMPIEAELEIGRRDIFFTDRLTNQAKKYALRHIDFAPVTDHIKLVRGEINYLILERNLFHIDHGGEKELVTKANTFHQDLNRTMYIGLDLSIEIKTLQNIHFFFDYPTTEHRYNLYDLLNKTQWSIDGQPISIDTSIANAYNTDELYGGIFSHYNTSYRNDEEVMELYRKQFLHIRSHIQTRKLEKTPFPTELTPFFPERVNSLEPQYWIKITLPAFFSSEDIADTCVFMNSFPVSNKMLNDRSMDRSKSLTGILSMSGIPGEYFLSVDHVEDSKGEEYNFLPYSTGEKPLGGTYSVKRGGSERFNTRDLSDTIGQLTDLFRSELVTFNALNIDNIRNSISDMEQIIAFIHSKMESNESKINEAPHYLLIDSVDKQQMIFATYWSSNCEIANRVPYGAIFSPLKSIPFEKNGCMLIKASSGGQQTAKSNERIEAYKYALTTRDQLYSVMDIENYCRKKFMEKIQEVKVKRGVDASYKSNAGLIRTVDVHLVPSDEYKEILFDPVKQGELKIELEKRSPEVYNYRIIVSEKSLY